MVYRDHPHTQSDAQRGLPPGSFLTFSNPPSSPEPVRVPPESSSPVFLPPAGPETPVRHNLPKLMTTKLFHIPEQSVRRNLFGNHLHGCPYNDAHLLGMADHPTPPPRHRSRLECNCAKLLEEGYDQVEEEHDNTVGAREMDGPPPPIKRGKFLDGKVCATLSWSSSPTKGDDDDDEMEDDASLPERPWSAAPSTYSSTCEGEAESAAQSPHSSTYEGGSEDNFRGKLYTDVEMNDVDARCGFEQESPDIHMNKLTIHTAFSSLESSPTGETADQDLEGQEDSDTDDDCDTICDAEYDSEMETEPQADYNHQGQDDTEDGCTEYEDDCTEYEDGCTEYGGDDDDGAFKRSQKSDFDNRAALTTLTGGPRKALWFPAEPLAHFDYILSED
ncbi:hypothetical protein L211DRAFT_854279 [Terfezia boudieri ATCC MYA-4762]|uniref:Uncharacterized protein n=1 Tax=Terfezia boudieri ATCC MYA-4762 TaxID=1051890 RepID=A0A3N4L956_9PEZI|nr:hypothetical protein L211DRAFT_854279 [Terfezia boudieri ATCC MYA-4762]